MSHGSSPAAWTAVLLCLTGVTIAAVALVPHPNWVMFTIGGVVIVLSALVGKVMAAAGLGVQRAPH